jgi:hypothetical protein
MIGRRVARTAPPASAKPSSTTSCDGSVVFSESAENAPASLSGATAPRDPFQGLTSVADATRDTGPADAWALTVKGREVHDAISEQTSGA